MARDPQGDPSATTWTVAIAGDSINRSAVIADPKQGWAWLVAAALQANRVGNAATDGITIQGMIDIFAGSVAPLAGHYAPGVILLCDGGTNDLLQNGTGAAAYAKLQTYVGLARAAGFSRIVWLTILVSAGYSVPGTYETERQAFNALLRSSGDVDAVIDADTLTITRADGLHPDVAGHATIATYATPIVRAAAPALP